MTQFLIRCHFRFKIFCESEQISSCIIHFFPADDFDLWTLSFVFLSFCAIAPPWPNFRIIKSDMKKPSLIIVVELFEKLRWNRDWKTSFQTISLAGFMRYIVAFLTDDAWYQEKQSAAAFLSITVHWRISVTSLQVLNVKDIHILYLMRHKTSSDFTKIFTATFLYLFCSMLHLTLSIK